MIRQFACTAVVAAAMTVGFSAFGQTGTGSSSSGAGLGSTGTGSSSQSQSGLGSSSSPSGQSGSQSRQSGTYSQSGQRMGAMDMDKLFIKHAAIDNMCEVQLSQMAQTKAQSQDVKQFAQQMVQDRQKAQTELQDLARKSGVQVPMSLPQDKQEVIQAFQQLQGADFDKQYISMMKADHAKAVSKYSDVAMLAKNQDLKQWVAGKVSDLQHHAQMVASLAGQQGLSASPDQAQPASSTIQPSGQSSQSQQPGASGSSSSSGLNGSSTSGQSGSSRSSGSTGAGAGSTSGGTSGSSTPSR